MTSWHEQSITSVTTLPVGVLIALGVVAIVELILDVVALIDLYRRPLDRVTLGMKWVWVLIILLVNLLGAIVYLIVGRKPAPATEQVASESSAASRATIADALYGDNESTP